MSQILIQGLLLSGLYALIAIGFTLIFSVGRVLNLAYGAYLMLGAYAYFWLVQVQGLPQAVGMLGALAVGVTAGVLKYRLIVRPLRNETVPVEIATLILAVVLQSAMILLFNASPKVPLFFVPALRVKGAYFALVTLAFMELMYQLVQVIRPDLTGGTRGMSGIPVLTRGAQANFYLSLALMGSVAILLWAMMRTRLGTALSAIGMNEEAVSGLGLDPVRLKLFAFMTGAAVAGLGGAFYVHYLGSLAPRAIFDITFLFTIIVAALLGGASTIIGPMLGAFFLTFLLEYLRRWLPGTERYFIYGLIALVVYMLQPKGLVEVGRRASARIQGARS